MTRGSRRSLTSGAAEAATSFRRFRRVCVHEVRSGSTVRSDIAATTAANVASATCGKVYSPIEPSGWNTSISQVHIPTSNINVVGRQGEAGGQRERPRVVPGQRGGGEKDDRDEGDRGCPSRPPARCGGTATTPHTRITTNATAQMVRVTSSTVAELVSRRTRG